MFGDQTRLAISMTEKSSSSKSKPKGKRQKGNKKWSPKNLKVSHGPLGGVGKGKSCLIFGDAAAETFQNLFYRSDLIRFGASCALCKKEKGR